MTPCRRPCRGPIHLAGRDGNRQARAMTAPPAEGVRVDWETVPWQVRFAIERICGSPVVHAKSQAGGFSPGVAARLECADGTRIFVKAVSAAANPDTPDIHRREAQVLRSLDPIIARGELPAPRLRGMLEADGWTALVLEDVDGRQPTLPWEQAELADVLTAADQLADALTPSPIDARSVTEQFADDFTGWRTLAARPHPGRIDSWSLAHLDHLAELERGWPEYAVGDTLLHADIRADNVLITGDRVMFVDWPHACIGAAFVDVALLAPSVAMQGGPQPGELLAMTRAGRAASREGVAAVVCAMAGYLTERALRPAPPGIPTVRAFQAAQGEITRRWLASLL
jgi:aminoglycoside phosphotransferase (APT) family kinase protein